MSIWTHTVTGGPWPARIGLRCRIVPPKGDVYPWDPRDKTHVVILIEKDPFADEADMGPFSKRGDTDVWSCCLRRDGITPIS